MKKTDVTKPAVGRLGTEAFLALVHRPSAGPMKDRRHPPRAIAKRRAIDEG